MSIRTAMSIRGIQAGAVTLQKLPRSAIPSDVERLIRRTKLAGVKRVEMDYYRFLPAGRALLTLTHPAFVQRTITHLHGGVVGGLALKAFPEDESAVVNHGRATLTTGTVNGNGPHGSLPDASGSGIGNVVILGIPVQVKLDLLREHLSEFKLAGTAGGQKDILSVSGGPPDTSTHRYLVRTASISEAHRMVRQLHMTYFDVEQRGPKWPMQCRVVY